MSRWYIIHAYSGFENKVREAILTEDLMRRGGRARWQELAHWGSCTQPKAQPRTAQPKPRSIM